MIFKQRAYDKDHGFIEVPFDFAPDVLHVGLHRTGTSFCQQKIFPLLGNNVKFYRQSEVKLRGSRAIARNELVLRNLEKTKKEKKVILLSQESYIGGLDHCNLDDLFLLKEKFPGLRIIVSVRSQQQIIPSLYFQTIKAFPYKKSLNVFIDELLESGKLDYWALTCKLSTRFKQTEVLYILAEETFANPSRILSEVSQFVGLPTPVISTTRSIEGNVNSSPRDYDILSLYYYNIFFRDYIANSWLRYAVLRLISVLVRFAAIVFPQICDQIQLQDAEKEKIIRQYEKSNRKFFQIIGKIHNKSYL